MSITTVAPKTETHRLPEWPKTPAKLRQYLVDVATKKDLYRNGRMEPLSDAAAVVILREGLKALQKAEEERAREQKNYLTKRYGTVLVGLDVAQPAEDDVIIVERGGVREQCIVYQGSCWIWRNGTRGVKFCAVSNVEKWRHCELSSVPVDTTTVEGQIKAALLKGREVVGEGKGLSVKPGAGPSSVIEGRL